MFELRFHYLTKRRFFFYYYFLCISIEYFLYRHYRQLKNYVDTYIVIFIHKGSMYPMLNRFVNNFHYTIYNHTEAKN